MFQRKQLASNDIWMRDPFVVTQKDITNKPVYVMFGTTDRPPENAKNPYGQFPAAGFDCYWSSDLRNWQGPIQSFSARPSFWADTQYWAPEVHKVEGYYYMIASFQKAGSKQNRCCQVLVAESVVGPYAPLTDSPITPREWSCLDATLHWQRELSPSMQGDEQELYLVFCREFTQVGDGEMWAMKVSRDLTSPMASPMKLFSASEAPWVCSIGRKHGFNECYVTDGPFMYQSRYSDELILLWSSFTHDKKYAVGICRSASGHISGPWVHDREPLFTRDGGHCMFFIGDDDQLMIALHRPNKNVWASHPCFFSVDETVDLKTGKVQLSVSGSV